MPPAISTRFRPRRAGGSSILRRYHAKPSNSGYPSFSHRAGTLILSQPESSNSGAAAPARSPGWNFQIPSSGSSTGEAAGGAACSARSSNHALPFATNSVTINSVIPAGKLKSEGTGVPILRTGEGGGAAENSFAVPLPGDFQSGALFPEGSAIPACERIIARLGIFNPLQIGAFFSGRGGDEGAAAVVAAVFGEAALGLFAVTPLFPALFRFKGGIDQLRRPAGGRRQPAAAGGMETYSLASPLQMK